MHSVAVGNTGLVNRASDYFATWHGVVLWLAVYAVTLALLGVGIVTRKGLSEDAKAASAALLFTLPIFISLGAWRIDDRSSVWSVLLLGSVVNLAVLAVSHGDLSVYTGQRAERGTDEWRAARKARTWTQLILFPSFAGFVVLFLALGGHIG